MEKYKLAILKNEDPYDHLPWVKACETFADKVSYKVIDLTREYWYFEIQKYKPDYLLLKPSGKTSIFRTLYQERVDILINDLGYKSYPSYDEIRIYENKRFFAYWAQANRIPHPKTYIFYHKKEAYDLILKHKMPLVGKLNIGASGNGIQLLHNKKQAKEYIEKAFREGLSAQTGPKLSKGRLIHRVLKKLEHPKELINRIKTYRDIAADKQLYFVILQQYIPHDFEWRVVRIGESFFAHKKIKKNEKASGSLLKCYENPPKKIFDFVRQLTNRFGFYSVSVDMFEYPDGEYLINEIQCFFGQSDPYQMLVNNVPGRYVYRNNKWIFEEGMFNTNLSYDLRLQNALELWEIHKK